MGELSEKLRTALQRKRTPATPEKGAPTGTGGALQELHTEVPEALQEAVADGARLERICAGRDLQPLEWALGGEHLEGGLLNKRELGPWSDEVTLLLDGPVGA